MAVSSEKVRMTITVDRELNKWMTENASNMGIPVSAFINILIREAKTMRDQLDQFKTFGQIYSELPDAQKKAIWDKMVEDSTKSIDD